jgi:hypothetical protein
MEPNRKESAIEKELGDDSPLKKLIKIFRTNTVVKHHFQGNGSKKPTGVASMFFKDSLSWNSSVIPGYTAYERYARYSDYCEMMSYPVIAKALQVYADETTQKDEDGKIIKITSESKEVEDLLQDLFDNVLQLNGKRIYKIVRDLCKYGDTFYLIDITTDNGVVNLIQMPANEVEREEGFDKNEPTATRFKWNARNSNQEIPNAFVCHFRLDGDDLFQPYGQSFLEAARRPWRQLVLLEDAMMVYRITRSAERRAFYLDMMGVPPENVEEVINKVNQELKKKRVVNEEGKIDLRYGATLDMSEDIIIPVRGSDSGTRIETLPGGQNIGDIEDIEFIQKNLFAALGIPKAFLTYDEGIGAKQVLTMEDVRFARTISKVQEAIIGELVKLCIIHLYMKGIRGRELIGFKIKMTNPSTVAEMQKNELWRSRMDLVQAAGQGVFDTTFIYKHFLKLSDDAIDTIRKGQIQDKIFQAKLLSLENAGGGMAGGAMGGMGGGMMGGMGGGMGGGMMGGMGGMPDLGGAPPNVSGMPTMPESFNPAVTNNGFGAGGKDLNRRGSDERIQTTRGSDESLIQDYEDVSRDASSDLGIDTIDRANTSPMGTNESINQLLKIFHGSGPAAEAEKYTVVNARSTSHIDLVKYLDENFDSLTSLKNFVIRETENVFDRDYDDSQKKINNIL